MRGHRTTTLAVGLGLTLIAGAALADDMNKAGARNEKDMTFTTIPAVPTCLIGSVQQGDPSQTSFIMLTKTTSGCVIPWHWHTAAEHLMIISGTGEIAMRDRGMPAGKPTKLKAGGFALLPAKHLHQFRCKDTCTFYLYSDGKFDIHYIDGKENEITPQEALEAVNEKPATAMTPVTAMK